MASPISMRSIPGMRSIEQVEQCVSLVERLDQLTSSFVSEPRERT